jgi:RNA polymerase sigma-70 factor (ECF subfamily)
MEDLNLQSAIDDDRKTVDTIISGDANAFELLIRRYNPVLYKIARGFGFGHHDAEDLLQDTHFAAYLNLNHFQFKSAYKTWISKIMIHKCAHKLNSGYRKYESPQGFINENIIDSANYKKDGSEIPLIKKEFVNLLEESRHQLPHSYKTVFILRELNGFSIDETAAVLKISIVNVKVRLNRAKAMLRKKLGSHYSSEDIYQFNLIYCNAVVEKVFERLIKD